MKARLHWMQSGGQFGCKRLSKCTCFKSEQSIHGAHERGKLLSALEAGLETLYVIAGKSVKFYLWMIRARLLLKDWEKRLLALVLSRDDAIDSLPRLLTVLPIRNKPARVPTSNDVPIGTSTVIQKVMNGFKPSNLVNGKRAISWAEIVSRCKECSLFW
jgi:hypothetical protein